MATALKLPLSTDQLHAIFQLVHHTSSLHNQSNPNQKQNQQTIHQNQKQNQQTIHQNQQTIQLTTKIPMLSENQVDDEADEVVKNKHHRNNINK